MLRIIFMILLALPIIGVLWLAAILLPAHWQIRQPQPPLPSLAAISVALQESAGPTDISYINTATQSSPIGKIGHPGILITWPNGKRFLIDTGMPPEEAVAFGKPMEQLLDAQPSQTYGAIHTQMGTTASTITGIAFTHLHSDHTDGLVPLCAAQTNPATVFQTPIQQRELNYTTTPGDAAVGAAQCARTSLDSGAIMFVPGYPGLIAIAAGGHTPGSTIYAVNVKDRYWVFAGDITNDMHALHQDVAKPWVYSAFIVPEDGERLQLLRQWLEAIDQTPGYEVLVAHDIDALAASAIPLWGDLAE